MALQQVISATAVARSLNVRGIRGKEGGAWQASSILNTAYNDFHEARNRFRLNQSLESAAMFAMNHEDAAANCNQSPVDNCNPSPPA